jgi:hypothetical protein
MGNYISAAEYAIHYKRRPFETISFILKIIQINKRYESYGNSLSDSMSEHFQLSQYSILGVDYGDALRALLPLYYRNDWMDYEVNDKEVIEFRFFAELISNLTVAHNDNYTNETDKALYQIENVIDTELAAYNLKIVERDLPPNESPFITQVKDPVAEAIAANTNETAREAIIEYLCAKTHDEKYNAISKIACIEEKEKKGLTGGGVLGSASLYIQLIRHKDEYKDKPEYAWFFKDGISDEYLDDLFHLAICVDSIKEGKDIAEKFDKLSNRTNAQEK